MGLELLRISRRRTQLETAFNELVHQDLDGRVLAFDTAAADAAAIALAAAQRRGRKPEPSS
jgi:predicted nucleic acid-binding protein